MSFTAREVKFNRNFTELLHLHLRRSLCPSFDLVIGKLGERAEIVEVSFGRLSQALANLCERDRVPVQPHLPNRDRQGRIKENLSSRVYVHAEMQSVRRGRLGEALFDFCQRLGQRESLAFIDSAFSDVLEIVVYTDFFISPHFGVPQPSI